MTPTSPPTEHEVLYYNRGTKCLPRLGVSIQTLRRVYEGPTTLMVDQGEEANLPTWVRDYCSFYDVRIQPIPDSPVSTLARKAQLWRYAKSDQVLFLDSDTVVCKPIDVIWKILREHGILVTRFCDWVTAGHHISRRIKAWEPVVGKSGVQAALQYPHAVNTGVLAWDSRQRDARHFLEDWYGTTITGDEKNCTKRIVDEIACQVILHKHRHHMLGPEWNTSVKHSRNMDIDPVIVHYHGSKHVLDFPLCDIWKKEYWDWQHDYTPTPGKDHCGDRRLRAYLKASTHDQVTIVSAANRPYVRKLYDNFAKWIVTPGLREHRFLLFLHEDCVDEYTRFFTDLSSRVEIYRWSWNAAQTPREEMLSAFVFGTSQVVKTPYWMKLDADIAPKEVFVWPRFTKHTITSQKWRFTKMKGDPDTSAHWFDRLDRWWGGTPHFTRTYNPQTEKRVSHRRFMSKCHIEKTEFTRRLAAKCSGRLPIPSQDTTAWYAATRWEEPVQLVNFRESLHL